MNKIKQLLCIVLTFAVLGGCAQIKKPDISVESTVTSVTESTEEQTPAAVTEETVTESATTEKQTSETAASSTTKKSVVRTTETKVVTTAKPTTAKPIVAATRTTTAVRTTVTEPVTQAATTVPAKTEDGIVIDGKKVLFGCGRTDIVSAFGNPTETLTEKTTSGETTTSLVYASDYSKLAIFQLVDGAFCQFYTCARNTVVTDGKDSYSIAAGGNTKIGETYITQYVDGQNGNKVYAFLAGYKGVAYFINEVESYGVQEKLVFHSTNAVRAMNGVAPLEYSDTAADCVRRHCKDMSARNYFAHSSPEGVSSDKRMKNAGINYVTCGENLYAGFDHAFGMTDDWYNSPGHRSNLLHEGFKYVGVGIAEGNDSYSVYSGQNFYT